MKCETRDRDTWFTYIVQCDDGSLYTGIAKNPKKRLRDHNVGKNGAKYTRSRRPVRLVFWEKHPSRSAASKREHQVKKMDSAAKQMLVEEFNIKISTP